MDFTELAQCFGSLIYKQYNKKLLPNQLFIASLAPRIGEETLPHRRS
jgi:hypothetical protein